MCIFPLQVSYFEATNHRIVLNMRKMSLIIAYTNVFTSFVPLYFCTLLPPYLELWQLPSYYCNGFLAMLPAQVYFKFTCDCLNKAGNQLSTKFQVFKVIFIIRNNLRTNHKKHV